MSRFLNYSFAFSFSTVSLMNAWRLTIDADRLITASRIVKKACGLRFRHPVFQPITVSRAESCYNPDLRCGIAMGASCQTFNSLLPAEKRRPLTRRETKAWGDRLRGGLGTAEGTPETVFIFFNLCYKAEYAWNQFAGTVLTAPLDWFMPTPEAYAFGFTSLILISGLFHPAAFR